MIHNFMKREFHRAVLFKWLVFLIKLLGKENFLCPHLYEARHIPYFPTPVGHLFMKHCLYKMQPNEAVTLICIPHQVEKLNK